MNEIGEYIDSYDFSCYNPDIQKGFTIPEFGRIIVKEQVVNNINKKNGRTEIKENTGKE